MIVTEARANGKEREKKNEIMITNAQLCSKEGDLSYFGRS